MLAEQFGDAVEMGAITRAARYGRMTGTDRNDTGHHQGRQIRPHDRYGTEMILSITRAARYGRMTGTGPK